MALLQTAPASSHFHGRPVSHGHKPCLGRMAAFPSSGRLTASTLAVGPPSPLMSDHMPSKRCPAPLTIPKGMMAAHPVQFISRCAIPEGVLPWIPSMGNEPFLTMSAGSSCSSGLGVAQYGSVLCECADYDGERPGLLLTGAITQVC